MFPAPAQEVERRPQAQDAVEWVHARLQRDGRQAQVEGLQVARMLRKFREFTSICLARQSSPAWNHTCPSRVAKKASVIAVMRSELAVIRPRARKKGSPSAANVQLRALTFSYTLPEHHPLGLHRYLRGVRHCRRRRLPAPARPVPRRVVLHHVPRPLLLLPHAPGGHGPFRPQAHPAHTHAAAARVALPRHGRSEVRCFRSSCYQRVNYVCCALISTKGMPVIAVLSIV